MATRIREKAQARQQAKDTRPYAKVKYVRMSPSKVRIVLDLVRGKKVDDAVQRTVSLAFRIHTGSIECFGHPIETVDAATVAVYKVSVFSKIGALDIGCMKLTGIRWFICSAGHGQHTKKQCKYKHGATKDFCVHGLVHLSLYQ